MKPTIGRIVIYRTDGRNGLSYDLPAGSGTYVEHNVPYAGDNAEFNNAVPLRSWRWPVIQK